MASLLFGGVALAILALCRTLFPSSMPDVGRWAASPGTYFRLHYRLIARTSLFELGIACLLVVLAERSLNHPRPERGAAHRLQAAGRWLLRHHDARVQPHTAWWWTFRAVAPTGSVPQLSVETKEGVRYTGKLAAYSPRAGGEDRDIVLQTPVEVISVDTARWIENGPPGYWQFIVLPAETIQATTVRYVPARPTPPSC